MSAINPAVTAWRQKGKHLPSFLRDFQDQKDLFKTMHELTKGDENSLIKEVNFIEGQCYVIDMFLWFMARHGYTLQKTRTKLEFEDIESTVATCTKKRDAHFTNLLLGAMTKNKEA